MKKTIVLILLTFLLQSSFAVRAQTDSGRLVFDEIKLIVQNGDKFNEQSVKISFDENAVFIENNSGKIIKTFQKGDINSAEYSYSKNPRWKTGLGLGAASVVFPPLLLVAIPIGFTKHRRHWITIRTEKDFAVLKITKKARKVFIPAFETRTGVKIVGVGENK